MLLTTEYRVLPNIRYSAEPSNRTEYRFSPTFYQSDKQVQVYNFCKHSHRGLHQEASIRIIHETYVNRTFTNICLHLTACI